MPRTLRYVYYALHMPLILPFTAITRATAPMKRAHRLRLPLPAASMACWLWLPFCCHAAGYATCRYDAAAAMLRDMPLLRYLIAFSHSPLLILPSSILYARCHAAISPPPPPRRHAATATAFAIYAHRSCATYAFTSCLRCYADIYAMEALFALCKAPPWL